MLTQAVKLFFDESLVIFDKEAYVDYICDCVADDLQHGGTMC